MSDEDSDLWSHVATAVLVILILAAGIAIATTHFVPTSGSVPLISESGPEVTLEGSGDANLQAPFNDSTTVWIETDAHGKITFTSPSRTNATIHYDDIAGTWTNVTALVLRSTELDIHPSDKPDVTVAGDFKAFAWTTPGFEDGNPDLVYTAGGFGAGEGTVTIGGLPATTDIVARNASGTVINVTTTDANGNATMTFPAATDEIVYLQSPPDSLIVDGAEPTGGQSTEPSELSVNASHDGDVHVTTDVAFYHEQTHVATKTVETNATATASLSGVTQTAGENNWSVVVTDELGNKEIRNYTYQTPDELLIYDEENPTTLVDTVQVNITFYEEGTRGDTFDRTTTTGSVDMSGLPVDTAFVAKADADGWVDRRIFIASLFEQQAIYLVSDTEDVVDVNFELIDFSGDFPKEHTVLQIQRNLDNGWKTVEGDYFGAAGNFGATLRTDIRHELRLVNTETGQTKDIGRFTPTVGGTYTLQVNPDLSATFSQPDVSISWDPAVETIFGSDSLTLGAELASRGSDLASYQITATWVDTGDTLFSASGSSADGESWTMNLDVLDRGAGTLNVTVEYTLQNGGGGTFEKVYSVQKNYENQFSLTGWLLSLPDNFASFGTMGTLLAIFITTLVVGFVGARTPASTELLGVIGLMSISFFALIGWVGWTLVFAGAVAWVGFAGLRRI